MNRKALVIASRTVLIMLLVAALVVLGLGVAIAVLGDPPEVGGWLRAIFGRVFAYVAVALAAVLGIPSGIGLWAMAGANTEGAVPALPRPARLALVAVGIGTVIVTAIVLVVTGSAVRILNLGLLALVAMSALGLAGAANFSPHRWRAAASGVALISVAAGALWILSQAFIGNPGGAA